MVIDETLAYQWLANVSYYRLSAYWYPARTFDQHGNRTDTFYEGTTFTSAVELYEADRKLRTLIHDGIERIEIAMRTQISELLCLRGPLSYQFPSEFRDGFNHKEWMDRIHRRVKRAEKTSESIRHYKSKYTEQFPIWVLAEVFDFSDTSKLYSNLKTPDQKQISNNLQLTVNNELLSLNQRRKINRKHPLTKWLEQLTIIRNTSAHHARLWNKQFSPAPTEAFKLSIPHLGHLPEGQSGRIFGALVMMAHILSVVSPGTTWPDKVTQLICDQFLLNPLVQPSSMGIPKDWDYRLLHRPER